MTDDRTEARVRGDKMRDQARKAWRHARQLARELADVRASHARCKANPIGWWKVLPTDADDESTVDALVVRAAKRRGVQEPQGDR